MSGLNSLDPVSVEARSKTLPLNVSEKYSVPALASSDKPFPTVVSGEVIGLPEPPLLPKALCIISAVQCPQSDICISQTELCDGRKDCPDGSDELNCMKQCTNKGKAFISELELFKLMLFCFMSTYKRLSFQCMFSF